jgi:hypothetical protein
MFGKNNDKIVRGITIAITVLLAAAMVLMYSGVGSL